MASCLLWEAIFYQSSCSNSVSVVCISVVLGIILFPVLFLPFVRFTDPRYPWQFSSFLSIYCQFMIYHYFFQGFQLQKGIVFRFPNSIWNFLFHKSEEKWFKSWNGNKKWSRGEWLTTFSLLKLTTSQVKSLKRLVKELAWKT